jgi:hypothetical protein
VRVKPIAPLDPKRLGVLIGAFNLAFTGTPEDADLMNRTRMALETLPDEIVREFGDAAGMLVTLTRERLGEDT